MSIICFPLNIIRISYFNLSVFINNLFFLKEVSSSILIISTFVKAILFATRSFVCYLLKFIEFFYNIYVKWEIFLRKFACLHLLSVFVFSFTSLSSVLPITLYSSYRSSQVFSLPCFPSLLCSSAFFRYIDILLCNVFIT